MSVYESLGASRVINASGRMTALGGALLSPEAVAAMGEAATGYVDLVDLKRRAGRRIAELFRVPDAVLTTGAAAGIVTMVAAVVAGTDPRRVELLPNADWEPRGILLQAGHQVDFGGSVLQMIRMGGGVPHPVGAVNLVTTAAMRAALGGQGIAAVLFVQSHHAVQKGMLSLPEVIDLAHEAGVAVLVDAAAEEDGARYVGMGADLVAYSGGKAFEGPTSGFIVGRAELVAACRAQEAGVARPMKVGKETIAGLVRSLEQYVARNDVDLRRRWDDQVSALRQGLSDLPELVLDVQPDEAGRAISRLAVRLAGGTQLTLADLVSELRSGEPRIEVRAHHLKEGFVQIDPRPLGPGDAECIVERIRAIVESRRSAQARH